MSGCDYCLDTGLWPPRGVGCDDVFPQPCPEGCPTDGLCRNEDCFLEFGHDGDCWDDSDMGKTAADVLAEREGRS